MDMDRRAKTGVPLDIRVALLRQYGNFSQAYSVTYQPDLKYFGDRHGFLAYALIAGTALVLADPVAPRQDHPRLIRQFLDENPDVCFCATSRATAEILAPLGFFINEMGYENRIDLATYSFDGAKKEHLRRGINRMRNSGSVIKEGTIDSVGAAEIGRLSDRWRHQRVARREVAFINRPISFAEEPDVRRFFTFDRNGKLVAFGFFDPVYENGEVIGYMSQHNRHLPEADAMTQFAIRKFAMDKFREEGKKWMYLGLSPLAGIKQKGFGYDRMVYRAFHFAYKSAVINRFFYPLQSLCEHKRRYHAATEQTYFAFNRGSGVLRLLKLARACKIV